MHLLRRVERFVWKVVKQTHDLIIDTMLLCDPNEISFANRKWNMPQQLIQRWQKIPYDSRVSFWARSCKRTSATRTIPNETAGTVMAVQV